MKPFKDLEIYNLEFEYSLQFQWTSLQMLHFELYEQGSQVHRSSKVVKDSIIEGYGRCKQDFIKFLAYSHTSLLACRGQLGTIQERYAIDEFFNLRRKYDGLGAKIFASKTYVEKNWKT